MLDSGKGVIVTTIVESVGGMSIVGIAGGTGNGDSTLPELIAAGAVDKLPGTGPAVSAALALVGTGEMPAVCSPVHDEEDGEGQGGVELVTEIAENNGEGLNAADENGGIVTVMIDGPSTVPGSSVVGGVASVVIAGELDSAGEVAGTSVVSQVAGDETGQSVISVTSTL